MMMKETLEKEYYKNKLTQEEIAEKYSITRHKVMSYFNKYDMRPLKPYERNGSQELSQTQHEFMIGTMLGDGCLLIMKNGVNAWLTVKHGLLQLDYVKWKYELMKDFAVCDIKIYSDMAHGKNYDKCYFRTICHPLFTDYQRMFYDSGVKVITNEIANELTPLAIAIWYMDDGTTDGKYARFCTNSYTEPELKRLQKVMMDKFGLVTTLHIAGYFKGNNQAQYNITLTKKSTYDFIDIVKPYIIDSMRYKIDKIILSGASEIIRSTPHCVDEDMIQTLNKYPATEGI
jgi:hypothetical protein